MTNIEILRFSESKIYKITHNETRHFYIGSTNETLYVRIKQHIVKSETDNRLLYEFVKRNGGWGKMSFEVVERLPIDCTKDILMTKEREYLDQYHNDGLCLNSNQNRKTKKIDMLGMYPVRAMLKQTEDTTQNMRVRKPRCDRTKLNEDTIQGICDDYNKNGLNIIEVCNKYKIGATRARQIVSKSIENN